jgi:hypothetical protein
MSYAHADHAGWVQANIAHGKKTSGKPRRDQYGFVKGWHGAPDTLTDFQAKVMDILGMVYGGIYNAPIAWDAVQWCGWGGDAIGVPVGDRDLATFDGSALTRLVFLCHEARIRCEVRVNGPRGFLLAFWQRVAEGGTATRHPNIEEAVTAFREYLPADHRIVYRAPAVRSEAA